VACYDRSDDIIAFGTDIALR